MPNDPLHLICYSVNLAFIVVNLYSWLLKRFFVPEAYKANATELYPAQRAVAGFYLLQLFEIPYLLMVGRPEALFYVNGTGLLVFSSFILVMVRKYFFLQQAPLGQRLLFLLPVWLCWVALLLPLFDIVAFSSEYQWIMTAVVLVAFSFYMFQLDRFRRQLMRRVREVDESEYSNEGDFPVKFARSIKWLPLTLCLMLAANFLLNNPIAKLVRDAVFTVICVWFAIYTINPHRKLKQLPQELNMEEEGTNTQNKYHLTEEQCKDMETKILDCIVKEKLFLEDHFTMNDLIQRLNTNKTYLSEVIARSPYKSFYQLVNTLRIDHACQILEADPSLKLEQVAFASGFSSGSAFSQVFKRIKGVTPSEYLRK